MAKQSKINSGVKMAQDPVCTISMDNEYELNEEKLKACTPPALLRKKDWKFPALKFISYNNGNLLLLNSWDKRSYELVINTQPGNIQVSCSCGQTGNLLCLHAYRALARLIWTLGDGCLTKYLPGGPVDLAYKHKDLFKLEWEFSSLRIYNRKEKDTIYLFDTEPLDVEIHQALELPTVTPAATSDKGVALTYIINLGFRNRIFPSLFPCLGTLNKEGTQIIGFDKFLSGISREYESMHTDEQRVLNLLCYDLYSKTEPLAGSIRECLQTDKQNLIKAFELWRQGFQFLRNQPFVFSHILYQKKDLKGKPAKTRTSAVEVQGDIPIISFLLQQKGDIYKLEMIITLHQKRVNKERADVPFFLLLENKIFMWSTLRDAAIAERFSLFGGSLIILKEHFAAFDTTVLKPLSKHYKIEKKMLKK